MLELKNLTTGYKKLSVLQNLSLRIGKNEFVGIIGPNGGGKSTLLRSMCGILSPWQGEILINGKSITSMNKKEIARKIGYVPQFSSFVFPFTCEEIVLMGRYAHKKDRKRDYEVVGWAMELTDTIKLGKRRIDELSGGELQRVVIARAIAQEPDILLLDEPTSHLDINHQMDIFKLLDSLKKKGITIIAVLHNLNLASEHCKRIVVIKDGKILYDESPERVINKNVIKSVYGVEISIIRNPSSNLPLVLPP